MSKILIQQYRDRVERIEALARKHEHLTTVFAKASREDKDLDPEKLFRCIGSSAHEIGMELHDLRLSMDNVLETKYKKGRTLNRISFDKVYSEADSEGAQVVEAARKA